MKAAFHGNFTRMFKKLIRLLSKLPENGGISYIRIFFIYIIATQDQETVSDFVRFLGKHSKKMEGEMITAAEAYKMEGKMENTIEMIENLLKEGADWNFIYRVAKIDRDGFQKLKEKWQRNN